ncbi:MAG: hypothetical protein Q3979_04840 [Actinomycetaceae bacterium]|nr:hypothetical protein [Actinomycetaceae bacterium]
MATLAKRLGEISTVSMDMQHTVRNARTTRADIVEFGLVTADELRVGFLPEEYRNAVYRLYDDELLSPERAMDLLQGTATVGDLPELPPRHENEIWNYV